MSNVKSNIYTWDAAKDTTTAVRDQKCDSADASTFFGIMNYIRRGGCRSAAYARNNYKKRNEHT